MAVANEIPDFEGMVKNLRRDLMRYASRTAVNWFQDSFYNQGFTDAALEPWQKRKNDVDPGRKILIKSASLQNSIRTIRQSNDLIEVGSNEVYAEIHNEGGTIRIPVTERSRKYFWYMYKATGNEMYKAMALTKKTEMTVHMPKRQFIGESERLNDKIGGWLEKEINKRFTRL